MKTISILHTPYGSFHSSQFLIKEGEENINNTYEHGHLNSTTAHKVYRVFKEHDTTNIELIAKIYAGSGVSVIYNTI